VSEAEKKALRGEFDHVEIAATFGPFDKEPKETWIVQYSTLYHKRKGGYNMQTLELSEYHDGNGYFGWRGETDLDDGTTVSVKILQDDVSWGDGPRDWDNLGTMVCFHNRYTLGDEQGGDPQEYLENLACALDDTLEDRIYHWNEGDGWTYLARNFDDPIAESDRRIERVVNRVLDEQVPVMLPLYLYDHSGITMRTTGFSCPWDSGQVGFIYVTKEKLRQEYSVKRVTGATIKRAEGVLKGEVETYDDYLTGNVWGYSIEVTSSETCDTCGHTDHPTEFDDSCWGFYGDPRN